MIAAGKGRRIAGRKGILNLAVDLLLPRGGGFGGLEMLGHLLVLGNGLGLGHGCL
jgi:hypothetical protein